MDPATQLGAARLVILVRNALSLSFSLRENVSNCGTHARTETRARSSLIRRGVSERAKEKERKKRAHRLTTVALEELYLIEKDVGSSRARACFYARSSVY